VYKGSFWLNEGHDKAINRERERGGVKRKGKGKYSSCIL
jgi:hypothetical protein